MSLINKMLKDLDSRQSAGDGRRPIFEGLQPARHTALPSRRVAWPLALTAVSIGVAATAWWMFDSSYVTPVAAPVAVKPAAPLPVPVSEPAVVAPVPPSAPPPATKTVARQSVAAPAISRPVSGNVGKETTISSRLPREPAAGHMEKTDRPYTAEELAEDAYREAVSLRANGNSAGAERRLKELLATTPRHVKARELLVSIQNENGRWVEARGTLEAGMARMPEYVAFRLALARLLLQNSGEKEAIAVLEAGRVPGRTDPELQAFLAALYQRAARHAEAVSAYREALGANNSEGRWWVGLGISLEAQQDNTGARDAYQHALASTRLPANLAQYAEGRLQVLSPR